MEKYILNNRNYYIINNSIDYINIEGIIKTNISEYRILLISRDFSVYNKKNLEKFWIKLITSGIIEISLLGKNANILENEIDNILVNLHLQNNKKNYLNIITLSENNLKEIEDFSNTFFYGGLSIENNIIVIDDNILNMDIINIISK